MIHLVLDNDLHEWALIYMTDHFTLIRVLFTRTSTAITTLTAKNSQSSSVDQHNFC
jgi:hypothetical protein